MQCIGEEACAPANFNCGTGKCLVDCAGGLSMCQGLNVNTNGAASFMCTEECPCNVISMIYTWSPTKILTTDPTSYVSRYVFHF